MNAIRFAAPLVLALARRSRLCHRPRHLRRVKVDGGCYEVYALDDTGKRVEAYFHPRTLAPVPAGSKDHKG